MASDYLSKYYTENNPVTTRLTIVRKILTRVICFIIFTLIFFVLRILNKNKIFQDISPILLVFIYIVMFASLIISITGLVLLLILLINKEKGNSIINVVPFNTKKKIFMVLDWLLIVPICICVAIFAYGYLFRIQSISGDSMLPNFESGERVIITYKNDYKRGDVVVCRIDKKTFEVDEDAYWIKRIIGLPGDRITWNEFGLTLNGKLIDEDYVYRNENGTMTIGTLFNGEFVFKGNYEYEDKSFGTVIPKGYVFIMGDNRGVSQDGRYIGLVPVENVVGVVRLHFDGLDFKGFVERGALE